MITFAITTTDALVAGTPPCEFCDADMALREIGDGVYAVEVHHARDCTLGLPVYE